MPELKLSELATEFVRYQHVIRDVVDYPDYTKSQPVIMNAMRELRDWFAARGITLVIEG